MLGVSDPTNGKETMNFNVEFAGIRIQITAGAYSQAAPGGRPNQDRVLCSPGVFAVADGITSIPNSQVAAEIVLQTLQAASPGAPLRAPHIAQALRIAQNDVNSLRHDYHTPGTTVCGIALVCPQNFDTPGLECSPATLRWLVFNIGDSRAYCFEGGLFTQLTVDHTAPLHLREPGPGAFLVPENRYPGRQADIAVLSRGIGAGFPPGDPDQWLRRLEPGQCFVICTDGVYKFLSPCDFAEVLGAGFAPELAARSLVDRARKQGSLDDASAVVLVLTNMS